MSICHFAKLTDEEFLNRERTYAGASNGIYFSKVENNIIKIYDKNRNLILEDNFLNINTSLLDDDLKYHINTTTYHYNKNNYL